MHTFYTHAFYTHTHFIHTNYTHILYTHSTCLDWITSLVSSNIIEKTQPIKTLSYGSPITTDTSTIQLLHLRTGVIVEEGAERFVKARESGTLLQVCVP